MIKSISMIKISISILSMYDCYRRYDTDLRGGVGGPLPRVWAVFCCWPWFKLFKLLSCGLLLALAAALVLALALAATVSVSLEFLEHTSDSLDSAARSLPWCRATVQSSIHGSDIVGEGTLKQKEIGQI